MVESSDNSLDMPDSVVMQPHHTDNSWLFDVCQVNKMNVTGENANDSEC